MGYDIRQEILRELKRRNWSIYRFAKELDGKVNIRVVYQYLSEGQDTGTEWASKMLKVLGLTIIGKSNVQVGKCPRKEALND